MVLCTGYAGRKSVTKIKEALLVNVPIEKTRLRVCNDVLGTLEKNVTKYTCTQEGKLSQNIQVHSFEQKCTKYTGTQHVKREFFEEMLCP